MSRRRTTATNQVAHHDFLEALEAVGQLIANPSSAALAQALSLIAHAVDADLALLYRDQNPEHAVQIAYWLSQPATQYSNQWQRVDYASHRELRETLEAGLMFERPLCGLTPATQILLAPSGVQYLRCIPLAVGSDLIGFLALAYIDGQQARQRFDARFLSALSNQLAQALARADSEARLKATAQRLATLVGATEDMVFEINGQGIVVNLWSHHPALPQTELLGLSIKRAFPQDMAWALSQARSQALQAQAPVQFEFTLPRLEGACYCIGRLTALPSEDGQEQHLVALIRDVTDLMREEAQRRVMLETLDLLEEAVVELDLEGCLQRASRGWATLRGVSGAHKTELGHPLSEFIAADDQGLLAQALAFTLQNGEMAPARFRLLREGAAPIWLEANLLPNWAADGQAIGLRGILRDVTAAHLSEAHIRQLALYDSLTGLPNRLLLDDLLDRAIARSKRNHCRIALGFIDLDHFKQINDAFGHQAGDRVLATLAQQIRSVLREEDVLARWGGDEFVVMLPDLPDLSALSQVAERLREIARQGVVIEGIETRPTISIGMAVYPDNADSAEGLLRVADSTMYHAKSMGRNNVQFYSDMLHLKSLGREHMAIQTRLNRAVLGNELQVFYQPIINSRSGQVSSVEALVRWQDERAGWLSPQLFIPMAEKLGLISELSEQVMVQALGKLRNWRKMGLTQQLTINISRSLLFSPRFIEDLMRLVDDYALRPADIIIEITESLALTDQSRQSKHLRLLHQAGFKIAIDDFGTGYSSLSQLHEMPIDLLKVDLSFTARLNQEAGRRIMQAIVQMAHSLGIEVVVEGVETLDALRFLQGLGVEKMQGFYFSEAVPAGVCELHMRLGFEQKV